MILLEYFEIVAKCLSPYNISTYFCLQDGNDLTETPFSEHSHCQHLQTTLMLCRELDSPPQKLIVIASAMLNWIPMVIWAIEYACEGPSLRVLITQKYLVTLVISRPTEDLCNLLWPRQHSIFFCNIDCYLCSDLHAVPPPERKHPDQDAAARSAWDHHRSEHQHCEWNRVSGRRWWWCCVSRWPIPWKKMTKMLLRPLSAQAACPLDGKRASQDLVLGSEGHNRYLWWGSLKNFTMSNQESITWSWYLASGCFSCPPAWPLERWASSTRSHQM